MTSHYLNRLSSLEGGGWAGVRDSPQTAHVSRMVPLRRAHSLAEMLRVCSYSVLSPGP